MISTLLRKAVLEVSVGLIIINNIGIFNLKERVNAKGTIKIKPIRTIRQRHI